MSLKSKVKHIVRKILIHKCDRNYDRTYQYAKRTLSYDPLIRLVEEQKEDALGGSLRLESFSYSWKKDLDRDKLLQVAGNSDYVIMCDEESFLHVNALEEIENFLVEHPQTQLLYGDEDVVGEKGVRRNPWFKPAWSPTLFLQQHYVGGLLVAKSELILQVLSTDSALSDMRHLAYELCLSAGGFELRSQAIAHLDKVLSHQPDDASFERYLNCEEIKDPAAIETVLDSAKAELLQVSIVIPSKDQIGILTRNLRSLEKTLDGLAVEVIIVDNGSCDICVRAINTLIQDLTFAVHYIYEPRKFNFSAMCNRGAQESHGKYLLFLNDDIEALSEGWLEKMVTEASKGRVGCVGAKLIYPNTDKIQHAGVMELGDGPIHKLQYQSDSIDHYFGWNRTDRECLAVTGACLMIRHELFDEMGGFDEELPVTFNDIDLCYKLYAKGYYNVCLNSIFLYHHESWSRGVDESPEKRRRLLKERERLYRSNEQLRQKDPFYHIYLNRQVGDMRVLPALEESLDVQQEEFCCMPWIDSTWKEVRRHDCVHMNLEEGKIKGYMLMLGDDNACYQKRLLLRNMSNLEEHWCNLNSTLREDIQEGMPDQTNIALCGFEGKFVDLPAGEYEIKAVLHNKISGVTYWKETEFTVSITEE